MALRLSRIISKDKISCLIIATFAVGFVLRLLFIAWRPWGINPDEALAGYEAFSLLTTGVDTHGYPFPVYLTAWGSGMNALYSYLSMLPIAIFGLNLFSVRITQAVFGCLTLVVFYLFVRLFSTQKTALVYLVLLAINPWHIMLSRWGLESNLIVFFLMAGLYFFTKGLEKSNFFILSALFYGLSLYCYATIWLVLPVMLLLQVLYAVWCKKIRFEKSTLLAFIVLFVLALPLLLFLLINVDIIGEIRTSFFSIPKMPVFRSEEYHGKVFHGIVNLYQLFTTQSDGSNISTLAGFGFSYLFTLPFAVIGISNAAVAAWKGRKSKKLHLPALLLPNLLWGGICALFINNINFTRINNLIMPILVFGYYGIVTVFRWLAGKEYASVLSVSLGIVYIISFAAFMSAYLVVTPVRFEPHSEYKVALEHAAVTTAPTIYVDNMVYSIFLFETQYPPEQFRKEVVYNNYPDAFLTVDTIGRYKLAVDPINIDPKGVYCFLGDDGELHANLEWAGFEIQSFGSYAYAYHP